MGTRLVPPVTFLDLGDDVGERGILAPLAKLAVAALGARAGPRTIVRRHVALAREQPDHAIHRAGVDVDVAEPAGELPRHRALPGSGRAVDGDDQSLSHP